MRTYVVCVCYVVGECEVQHCAASVAMGRPPEIGSTPKEAHLVPDSRQVLICSVSEMGCLIRQGRDHPIVRLMGQGRPCSMTTLHHNKQIVLNALERVIRARFP